MQVPNPLRAAFGWIGDTASRLLFGDSTPSTEVVGDRDAGLFGPDSVAWRLHADASMLVAGLRAVVVQTLHPLVMAGVAEHSDFRHDPWGRLQRTVRFVDAVTYGTAAEVESVFGQVRGVHRRIKGFSPDGRPYDATDPHLVAWVHAVLVDSALLAYGRFGRWRLEPADADRYVAEMAIIGEGLGAEFVPRDVAGLRQWLADVDGLDVGPDTRAAALYLLVLAPVPLYARGAYLTLSAAAVSLLPDWARWRLGVPRVPLADPLIVVPVTKAMLAVSNRVLPPPPGRLAAETRLVQEGLPSLVH
ncbi:MAG: oxygenase MpaB family protein [Acidimicrobiia bacterium]